MYVIFAVPELSVQLEQRLSLSLISLLLLYGSYKSYWIKDRYESIFYILTAMYLTHYLSFCYLNRLPGETVFGYAMIQFAITLSFFKKRPLVIYLIYSFLLNIPFLFIETQFKSAYLILGTFNTGLIAFIILHGRLKLIKSIKDSNEKLKLTNEKMSLDQKIFYNLLYETSNIRGLDLYRKIAKEITIALDLKFCLIGLLNPNRIQVDSVGFACEGSELDNISYQLKGTPCEHVIDNCPQFYPVNLQQLFPEDKDLVEMNAESYVGVPLYKSSGEALGIILILDSKAMNVDKKDLYLKVLKVLGQRVAMEIERDNTNAQILEQQVKLANNAKLATLGEMSAGIAHEINNPLTVILGHVNYSLNLLSKDTGRINFEKLREKQLKVKDMVDRIGRIIKSLKTISRDSEAIEIEPQSLKIIVEDSLSFCEQRFKAKGIEFVLDIEISNEVIIECNYVEISQVLINLFTNAIHAVENSSAKKYIELKVLEKNTSLVEIKIIDSGHGVPEDIKEKVFDPFFSTKPIGEGTGLGLSLSKSIIEKHGGKLQLFEVDGNTCFSIELPILVKTSNEAA